MTRILCLVWCSLAAPALADTCLPRVDLPAAWTACAKDSDCTLASDACRSCGNFLPVNAAHRDEATKLDLEKRKAVSCVMTCEACSAAMVKVSCRKSRCEATAATTR